MRSPINQRNLGVWDQKLIDADRYVQHQEACRAQTDTWIKRESEDECFVDNVTNVELQLGRIMDRGTFKTLIEHLCDRLKVDFHPRLPTLQISEVKWVAPWQVDPITGLHGGLQKVYKMAVGSLQAPILPEWSLLERKKTVNAAGESIMIPCNVLAHGWRRAIVQLVHAGFVTRPQAERIIDQHGSGNRASWQVLMGYRKQDGREFVC